MATRTSLRELNGTGADPLPLVFSTDKSTWSERYQTLLARTSHNRGARVVTLLVIIWVLSVFDYIHTITGVNSGLVDESNPIAAWVVGYGATALLAFKFALVTAATIGMYAVRVRALTEITLLCMVTVLLSVLLRWEAAYRIYELAQHNAPPGYPSF